MDLDIDKVKVLYKSYKSKYPYYLEIDKYYYGNTRSIDYIKPVPNRSNARINTNFVQKLCDEEALYSFGNKVTYKAVNEEHKEALKHIDYYFKNNGANYDSASGKSLVEFHLGYEIKYTNKNGEFKCKWVNPLQGDMYYNQYDEKEFFMYVHNQKIYENNKEKFVDYMDIYDNKYVYYLDNNFKILDVKAHNMGSLPIRDGVIDDVRYTEENGYIAGDKTIYRTIKSIQDAIEQNLSDITQEITDFHNAILKFYGIKLEDKKDKDGNIIYGADGQPLKKEPIVKSNSTLYFGDKKTQDAEWLIKQINDSFIKNTRDDLKDLIYTLTSHIDNNEKMQSNLSGVALRSRLQSLEAKVKSNENAMEDIIRHRIKCLFHYLRLNNVGDFDENMIDIIFTPCVPQDIATIADVIAKIPHEVVSHETKRSWIANIYGDLGNEQIKINKENEASLPKTDLDREINNEED
nr:phage portal protein [Clostridium neonatale]DAW05966.1 MAG TPA: portal protein [Caudoviricetes sp.]